MKKIVTRIIAGIAAALMALSFAGCGQSNSSDRLAQILERGVLEVATEPYFAPNEFIDASLPSDQQVVGSDIKLAEYIADALGVELKIVPLEFAAVLSGVGEGKYDMAISALGYTPTRAETMNLSKAYYINPESEGYGLLVRTEDVSKFPDAAALADATLVVQNGSLQEMFVDEQVPEYKELKFVSATTDGSLMVGEGKADAAATAIATARLYIAANPGVTIADGFRFVENADTAGTRIAMPKGADTLTERVNAIIDEVVESGIYMGWYEEYTDYAASLGVD